MIELSARWASAILGTLLVVWSPLAYGQEYDKEITKTGVVEDDLFISGDDVNVQAEVKGDVIAMGDEVTIAATIAGDVIAMAGHLRLDGTAAGETFAMAGRMTAGGDVAQGASLFGGSVTWTGRVNGPLLIAGGSIRTDGAATGPVKILGGKIKQEGTVDGDILVAGGKVEFTETSDVVGKVWVTGGKADIGGAIRGELRIAAHTVEISGRIDGDVYIDGVDIEIDRHAVISGNLHYRSDREAEIHTGATIAGDVEFSRSETPRRMVGFAFAAAGMVALASVGGLILLGAALLLVCPGLFERASRGTTQAFWSSLGIGVAVVLAGPVVIALLITLVVGIPLAVFVGAVYVMVLLTGLLVSGTAIGERILKVFGRSGGGSYWQRLGVLALGVALLAIVALIPVAGAMFVLAALFIGSGSMARGLRNACRTCPT